MRFTNRQLLTRWQQLELRRALAGVGSLRVDAGAVLARLRVLALVDVGAVATGLVEGVPAVADTPGTKDGLSDYGNYKCYSSFWSCYNTIV